MMEFDLLNQKGGNFIKNFVKNPERFDKNSIKRVLFGGIFWHEIKNLKSAMKTREKVDI